MRDWLDAIPNLGVPGVPGVQPSISADHSGTPAEIAGVPGVAADGVEKPGLPPVSTSEHLEHADTPKPACAKGVLRDWHQKLSGLDPRKVPGQFTPTRWRQLVEDGCWLYETFASRAVRDGWSAHDLFGVHMGKPAWGGIVDRLRGSRDLEMTDCRAFWSHAGVREQFNRGAATMLLSSGLVLLWEIPNEE